MENTATANHQKLLKNYVIKDILEASPQRLLIKIYDLALVNCQKKNLEKTNEAIQTLINALRFDSEEVREISVGLMKLYQFCQSEMRKRNYEIVHSILSELRLSWLEAFTKTQNN